MVAFKTFPARVAQVRSKLAAGTAREVWCQDEMRVGQKNKLTYRWARKGSRPRATHDQRTSCRLWARLWGQFPRRARRRLVGYAVQPLFVEPDHPVRSVCRSI